MGFFLFSSFEVEVSKTFHSLSLSFFPSTNIPLLPQLTKTPEEAAKIKAAAAEKAAKQRALAERSEAERRALDEAARKADAEAEVRLNSSVFSLSLFFLPFSQSPSPPSLAALAPTFFRN